MAGWGGAEEPKTPITGKEETGCRSAIGVRVSEEPPPCVTSLSSANFQATGRGREETLGCPGKLYHLERDGAVPLGTSSEGGPWERSDGLQRGYALGLEGEQGQWLRGNRPPKPRILQIRLLSKFWHC